MKLNPVLLDAVARIGAGVKAPVAFQFFPLAATGLPYFELSRIVRATVPRATVFPEVPHERYMAHLAECDLFLCPVSLRQHEQHHRLVPVRLARYMPRRHMPTQRSLRASRFRPSLPPSRSTNMSPRR
jgi:hypothetical protein